MPITHTAPDPMDAGVELPSPVKTRLGLDAERSWVMLNEGNEFLWPGPDLRFVPGRGPESVAYGFLPARFFEAVRQRFVARVRAKQAGLVWRGE